MIFFSFVLLQDLSGSIDDLPMGTEAPLNSAISVSAPSNSQGEQGNQTQSAFSPHNSPRVSSMRPGPSPPPVASTSPAGSNQISPPNGTGKLAITSTLTLLQFDEIAIGLEFWVIQNTALVAVNTY